MTAATSTSRRATAHREPPGRPTHIPAIHGPRPDRARLHDCGTPSAGVLRQAGLRPWSTTRDMDEETARAIHASSDPQGDHPRPRPPRACRRHPRARPENKKKETRQATAGRRLFGDGTLTLLRRHGQTARNDLGHAAAILAAPLARTGPCQARRPRVAARALSGKSAACRPAGAAAGSGGSSAHEEHGRELEQPK